jgi:hypothetical protein
VSKRFAGNLVTERSVKTFLFIVGICDKTNDSVKLGLDKPVDLDSKNNNPASFSSSLDILLDDSPTPVGL